MSTGYRADVRRCPACAVPMRTIAAAEAAVEVCDRCTGVWIEFFDGEPSGIARVLAPRLERKVAQRKRAPTCPECKIAMEEALYLDDGPVVDRCGGCLALFATREQLDRLAAYRAPRQDPTPSFFARLLAAITGPRTPVP